MVFLNPSFMHPIELVSAVLVPSDIDSPLQQFAIGHESRDSDVLTLIHAHFSAHEDECERTVISRDALVFSSRQTPVSFFLLLLYSISFDMMRLSLLLILDTQFTRCTYFV